MRGLGVQMGEVMSRPMIRWVVDSLSITSDQDN